MDDGVALGGLFLEDVAAEVLELAAGGALVVGVDLDHRGGGAFLTHHDAAVVLEGLGGQRAVVAVVGAGGEDGVPDADDEQDHGRGGADDDEGAVALGGPLLLLPLFPELLAGALARFTPHGFLCF